MAHRGRRSVDAARYSMVPRNDIPRSAFDLSHTHKTSFDARWLVPVYVDEVLPGDSFRVRMNAFCRLATPIVPVMDNLHLETFFFFVPNRLVWDKWQRFMGEQENPGDTTQFLVPEVPRGANVTVGDMFDYFGISQAGDGLGGPGTAFNVNALPFRAYNLIYNEWFRDEDLQDRRPVNRDSDGPDDPDDYILRPRGKRHDYFTSARPWPQKPMAITSSGFSTGGTGFIPGGPMTYPQAGAPVSGIGVSTGSVPSVGPVNISQAGGRISSVDSYYQNTAHTMRFSADPIGSPDIRVLINDIRTANAVQVLLEQRARGGTRYAELLRKIFGVTPQDARLQRPEYLGGGHSMINIHPIAQQSATGLDGGTTVLGELAGIGTAIANRGHEFSQSFTEHGFIIGLVNVRADMSYQQGTERMWFRKTQLDYYWPPLAHLGEQAILRREIFSNGSANDVLVFGYQGRYDEYRYKPNRVSGAMRSFVDATTASLDMWHFSQLWSPLAPNLNSVFIEEDPPIDRVLQVTGESYHQILMDALFEIRKVSAMPMFGIPGLGPRL